MTTPSNQKPNNFQGSLTSDPEQFSNSAWSLLLESEEIARRWKHQNLDVEHLIQVLFSDANYNNYVKKIPINHSDLMDRLEEFLAEQKLSRREELYIGDDLEILLENADKFRLGWGSKLIEISHIIFAIGRDRRIGGELFESVGMPIERLEAELRNIRPGSINRRNSLREEVYPIKDKKDKEYKTNIVQDNNPKLSSQDPRYNPITISKSNDQGLKVESLKEDKPLELYGRDLTNAASSGELDPVIGRDQEIRSLIKVLSRRGKNNPVLIGAPGVGKTAIAELLAQRIVNSEVPDSLKGLSLVSLDLGALIAGTKFRGQFEERFRSVLAEISDNEAGVILFIDEIHSIISSDRSSSDIGSLLKPLLASGDLRCIGATTPEQYRRTIEKDQILNRRFQKVLIKEPSLELSLEILEGVKERYETHHGVKISDEAINTANRLADRYISDRCLPDKAIDLIDEASAQLKVEATSKPQVIEEAEAELRSLEKALLSSDKRSEDFQVQLEEEKSELLIYLSNLKKKWALEQENFQQLYKLQNEEEEISNSIYELEQIGDLEEASRLKYDQLPYLRQKREDIEQSLLFSKESGDALLRDEVEPQDIADVVSRWTGIPVHRVLAEERQKLLNLEKELNKRVIGQAKALEAVAAAIRRARAGMKDPKRPIGSFLFLGPTGVGKTELAKALATALFDEEDALIRLDMSEFMERNAVARLLGAPPGYVGYEEGGQLTEAVRHKPYTVLLLDEIEKAHPDVFNLLLQVLDDGRLTDSQGRTIDFRHTVIVMTSNLASKEILENAKRSFQEESEKEELAQKLSEKIDIALNKQFRPEFLNRIDEVIRFNPLTEKDLRQIVSLHLAGLSKLLAEQGLELKVEDETIATLASLGYEPEYGARPLRRVIRRKLENPLANELLGDYFHNAKAVLVKPDPNESESLLFFAES